ncbi:EF-hand domain-containing protein [Bradyrhizobium diazoefficiens]|nr:EF-hand domain-containing protein [Bradyrhizobium diazoefficiens]MBR0846992.1 EF-hand domain-containing protein [Bradyrhizobium diazoefficiens]
MLFALGAVSSALDMIQSLTNSKSSAPQDATNPFALASGSTSGGTTSSANAGKLPQISPETMNALFAAQSQSSPSTGVATSSATTRDAALKHLFSQIDADGDGKITKTEFEDALGAGGTNLAKADDVFSKMDADADGGISLDEMSKALKSGHHGHHAQAADGDGSDSAAKPRAGSTSTTTTNADGSTTTTVTYADGFKMSTTVPGASGSRNSAYDLFAQLMQQQGGQGQGASAGASMSLSV